MRLAYLCGRANLTASTFYPVDGVPTGRPAGITILMSCVPTWHLNHPPGLQGSLTAKPHWEWHQVHGQASHIPDHSIRCSVGPHPRWPRAQITPCMVPAGAATPLQSFTTQVQPHQPARWTRGSHSLLITLHDPQTLQPPHLPECWILSLTTFQNPRRHRNLEPVC